MTENNIDAQVKSALTNAKANLKNSKLTGETEEELRAMVVSINGKMGQLKQARAELSDFIEEHTATPRM